MKTFLSAMILFVGLSASAEAQWQLGGAAGQPCCLAGICLWTPQRILRPIVQRANPYYLAPGGQLWVPRRVGVLGWRVRWHRVPRVQ